MINNTNYKLFFTSKDCIKAIRSKILSAKESIDIEIYYFTPDNTGVDIINLLKQKSSEGVKVRLLLDHVGSLKFDRTAIIRDLNKHNIEIRFFNSIIPFTKNRKTFLFLRNHRRSIIIDDTYVFTGGLCISDQMIHWLELCILIKDKNINNAVKKIFNNTWNRVYYPTFKIGKSNRKYLKEKDSRNFSYLTQSPFQFERYIYKEYLRNIKNSKKEITLVAPYFIPDFKLQRYLKHAVKNGVKVNIILPIKSNWIIADIARNTYINFLIRNHINIKFIEKMIHSKFAIFDDKAFVGTMNLDNLSLKYNYESGVLINDRQCVEELKSYSNFLMSKSFSFTEETWKNRSVWLKIFEKIIWPIRKFL